jgi:hypothetical protein
MGLMLGIFFALFAMDVLIAFIGLTWVVFGFGGALLVFGSAALVQALIPTLVSGTAFAVGLAILGKQPSFAISLGIGLTLGAIVYVVVFLSPAKQHPNLYEMPWNWAALRMTCLALGAFSFLAAVVVPAKRRRSSDYP